MKDLGVCSEGVEEAIRSEDFEQAAQLIHRFLTLDKAVFQLGESSDKEAGQTIRHSYEVLSAARTRLKEILEKRLDDAIARHEIAEMQRYVKLFPLINEHESGLSRFAMYFGGLIRKQGEENIKIMNSGGSDDSRLSVLYADTLFLFLENVASLLEVNQPLIENAYGSDKLLDFIIMLQRDNDHIIESILNSFNKKRQIDRFARSARKLLREGNKKNDRINPLELDALLSELCLMNTHVEMYWRFVKRRLGEKPGNTEDEFVMVGEDQDVDENTRRKMEQDAIIRKEERQAKLDQLLHRSLVGTKIQELLGQYILLEQYYMEESVRKAIEIDAREEGYISSVVEDVMFIVRKCVRRAMTSGSIDCVCAALNNGCALLETTYFAYLEDTIKAGYPSGGFAAEAFQTAQTAYNVIQHGKTVVEAGPEAQRDAFIIAINNSNRSAELVLQLKSGFEADWSKKERNSVDAGKLEHSLSQLDEVKRKMANLALSGVSVLSATAFRPKIKSSTEVYMDLPHILTEAQFSENEGVDPFVENFNASIDKQLAYFEPFLHKDNYQNLLLEVCTEIARQMERVILKCNFNRLGGLQLDKEFRHLSAYLSGVAGWSAREKTVRLTQIVSLLNVESVEEAKELFEAGRGSIMARSLTPGDVEKVLLLRVDLSAAQIKQLNM
ncbi:unnamed protein product [Auanema sp. JU1783]|nr:unnamed protein product [Auanema sp. JU1783]